MYLYLFALWYLICVFLIEDYSKLQGPAQVAPLPLEPLSDGTSDDRRLWIGNLDPRVREYVSRI